MQVKLKVLHGSNAGREIKVGVSEFIIGRKEGCHIRPRSDLVSRKHCMLVVSESGVIARDLKSRNGTYVNGERITDDCQLKFGDRVKIGKLEFEVLIDHGLGGTKKPEVRDVKEVAARTVATPTAAGDDEEDGNVGSWLEEADEAEREQRMTDPDTRQFRMDETDRVSLNQTTSEETKTEDTLNAAGKNTADDTKILDKKKKEPGKLPKLPGTQTKDSRDAAAKVLKDFFNRR